MSASIDWTLSPCDVQYVSHLRYAPVLFFGGYLGLLVVVGLLTAPALISNPEVLVLVVILLLVGGPMSLLYLWPMIRDPDQRPDVGRHGWLTSLDPVKSGLTAVVGTGVVLLGTTVVGGRVVYALLLLCVFVPTALVTVFDGHGHVDPDAGTLTFQERTVDLATLAAVQRYRFDAVTVCWLSYVSGESKLGNPRVVAFPESVSEAVLGELEAGVAADADVRRRETDRTAQLVLGVLAALSFGVGSWAVLVPDDSALPLAFVGGSLGLLFLVGAFGVA